MGVRSSSAASRSRSWESCRALDRRRLRCENLEIRVNNDLFTRYDSTTGPNKPYFYPINVPGGRRLTRHYPLEKVAGETHDHPHHRGLWFTHSAVNGEDYWLEGPRAAKTVH